MTRGVLADRDVVAVARRLLGARLERAGDADGGPVVARVVEVEAYDEDEPAAHTFGGRTPRNAVMFGPAGHLYVYRSHGLHWCANVVTGPEGRGAAVLLRAAAVVAGHQVVRARRAATRRDGPPPDHHLLRGPGNLGRGLALDGPAHDGLDLLSAGAPLRLVLGEPVDGRRVRSGPRVGVSRAADLPWRLWLADEPAVSPYRRSPRAPAAG